MTLGSDHWSRTSCPRRRVLVGLTTAGVVGLTGCLGIGGDAPAGDDSDSDEDSNDDSNGEGSNGDTGGGDDDGSNDDSDAGGGDSADVSGGGSGCPQWSSLSAYDVSGTDFVVEPSFPASWDRHRESYIQSEVEVGFGYPGSRTESGTSYPDNVTVTQVTAPTQKDVEEPAVEQGVYEEGDPVVIDGTEYLVATRETALTTFFQFTAPGPRDNYYLTRVFVNSERESCLDDMRATGRAVLDGLVPNDATTI